ncbi:hypothetical protein [Pseudonocardia sp.]|uniref:hypothetical protein n=1 Tax=Pseudonocardia sp. TaxID=60912 RepID=UPI002D803176|nr:hypothetical protein [Pseudonocardia sp.]
MVLAGSANVATPPSTGCPVVGVVVCPAHPAATMATTATRTAQVSVLGRGRAGEPVVHPMGDKDAC